MARAGRMRKTPLAAKKLETAAVRFPCCRSKIKAEKKANFTSCGEATTFQGTYSGVVFRSTAELPLVDVTHKGPALNCMDPTLTFNGPEDWVDRYGPSDVPLFWQESKPVSFWSAILEEFKFKSVFCVRLHSRFRCAYGSLLEQRRGIPRCVSQSKPHAVAPKHCGSSSMHICGLPGVNFVCRRLSG